MDLERLHQNLAGILARVEAAAERSNRSAGDVTLVAVTKRTTVEAARLLLDLGVYDLGENYPQELWRKAEVLGGEPVRWHLIGHLQGNKARRTVGLVSFIHAVDSLKLLRQLDEIAGTGASVPPVCLQVNCSGEDTKHGWSPEALVDESDAVAACANVEVVGLMTMAALEASPESARPAFVRLRETRDVLERRSGLCLRELSMGMSNDYVIGVEEGATLIRVGSALWEGVCG